MTRQSGMKVWVLGLALMLGAFGGARAQEVAATPGDERLARILERVGEGVARYQAGLFSITFAETLRQEELREDMTPKKSKEFVFETVVLREELSSDEDDYYPHVVRRLKSVGGKPAAPGRKVAEPSAAFNIQSLSFLLPKNRKLFEFSLDGEETLGGRTVYRLRMLRPGEGEPRVEWNRRLVGMSFRVFAPFVYLIWVDAESFDVLKLESHLAAPFEFESPRTFGAGPFGRFGPTRHLRYAVQDYSVRFRRERFRDPEQTLLVPESAEWLTVIEGAKHPRTRVTLSFSGYRRYRSDVKVIEEPEPEH
jgi:hypothetical protein